MSLNNFLVFLNQSTEFFDGDFYISDDKHKAVLTRKQLKTYNFSICCCMIFNHFDIIENKFICCGEMTKNVASIVSDLTNSNNKIKNVLIIDDTSFVVKYKDKVKGLDIFKKVVYNINNKHEIEYKKFNI